MSNQGISSSSKEIHMISLDTISLQTYTENYDKPVDKKEDNSSSDKSPPTGSPPSSSNGPPKSTLRKYIFNPNARAA